MLQRTPKKAGTTCARCGKSYATYANYERHKCKPKGPKESKTKEALKGVLRSYGCYQFWPVQYGMGKRTLDCIACVPVRITADMVGETVGMFLAVETKREGISTPTAAQANTIKEMRDAGAVALVVSATDDIAIESQLCWALRNGRGGGQHFINLGGPIAKGALGQGG